MKQLQRHAASPLYIQLTELLRAQIANKTLAPHQQLPSERDLCNEFRVSRMTVRQALAQLEHEGLIYSRVGKGTFVGEPKIDQQLKTLSGFTQEMRGRGSHPSSRVLEVGIHDAAREVAQVLQLSTGAPVILLSRLRLSDGAPLALETAHLPLRLCPRLLEHDMSHESLYEILEREHGYRLTRAEQTIEAALAGAREIPLLELTPPAPVLAMTRLTFTDQGVPIEFVNSIYRADRYKFHSLLAPRAQLPNGRDTVQSIEW
jgi:GntR family transcriptional regulator, N-acetylglucosamine utilization regulator